MHTHSACAQVGSIVIEAAMGLWLVLVIFLATWTLTLGQSTTRVHVIDWTREGVQQYREPPIGYAL